MSYPHVLISPLPCLCGVNTSNSSSLARRNVEHVVGVYTSIPRRRRRAPTPSPTLLARSYNSSKEEEEEEEEEDMDTEVLFKDVKMVTKIRSRHNLIRVLEIARSADHSLAGSRLLLLDRPGNIQSLLNPYRVLTHSYYDFFAALPPLLPHGPIAILGLGAATCARLLLHFWPHLDLHGWELDPVVIQVARTYFSLDELERGDELCWGYYNWIEEKRGICSVSSEEDLPSISERFGKRRTGRLTVHIGDALNADVEGGFAGILVDLFAEGAAIPALQNSKTWWRLKGRLKEGGRLMVNCGGSCVEVDQRDGGGLDGEAIMEGTLDAMAEVFSQDQLWRREVGKHGDSTLALSGMRLDSQAWIKELPFCLRHTADKWVSVHK